MTETPKMIECPICIEKFNKTLKKQIKCQYCDFNACRTCFQKYILDESFPKCMNTSCGREWTHKYICEVFPRSFINKELKEQKERILFDRERALLPATQIIIEERNLRAKREYEISTIRNKIRELQYKIYNLQQLNTRNIREGTTENNERTNFVRTCPDEECRGYLSSQWKCGLCNKWSCPECHEVKGIERDCEHVCNPENVATAKLLNRDTKSCPTCGTGIHKIDGCDQMWCTQCHTAFSWRTGKLEQNIHNPHYYEWLRRNGNLERNPNDVLCGRELDRHFIEQLHTIGNAYPKNIRKIFKRLIEFCRHTLHMRYVILPKYMYNEYNEDNNLELRVKYLQKKITEYEFRKTLQIQDKKIQKNRIFYNIFRLFIDTFTDILYRFHSECTQQNWDQTFTTINEVNEIRKYTNECLEDVSNTYKSIRYYINKNVEVVKYTGIDD